MFHNDMGKRNLYGLPLSLPDHLLKCIKLKQVVVVVVVVVVVMMMFCLIGNLRS
jgi:hypothetical protein